MEYIPYIKTHKGEVVGVGSPGHFQEFPNPVCEIDKIFADDVPYSYNKLIEFISPGRSNMKARLNDIYEVCGTILPKESFVKIIRPPKFIYSGPATIFLDGNKKTVVKCSDTEKFDWRKGALMAMLKATLSAKQWHEFVKYFHENPAKEKGAAEGILVERLGPDATKSLLKEAKKAWKESKSQK